MSTADEDVATGEDGNGMPAGDACAPPGSGGIGSSVQGCFAELSSSGRGGDLPRTTPAGFSEAVAAPGLSFESPPTGLGGGSRYALGIIGSGAFHLGSFIVMAALGGLPLVVSDVRHEVHSMSVTASADQLLSSVTLRTARVRNTPALIPTVCSSV